MAWLYAEKDNTSTAIQHVTKVINNFNLSSAETDSPDMKELIPLLKCSAYALRAEMYLQQRKYELVLQDANDAIYANQKFEHRL